MTMTPDLTTLIARLRTDQALQSSFAANPSAAVQSFDLTGHERDAVVTRDVDDLVALGAAPSSSQLPAALRPSPSPSPGVLDRLRQLRLRLRNLRRIDPPRPGAPRGPFPGPGPGP